MIEYIKGEIAELAPARMVLERDGIGYELNISLHTYSACNGRQDAKLYIHEVIREDAHLLYGFSSQEERELFLLLTGVSGVGPNTARTILSSYPPQELMRIISSQNEAALTTVKGIGLKTAQRILIDLRNKVKLPEQAAAAATATGATAMGNANVVEEAVAALVMLGYQRAASHKVVISILRSSPALPVEQVIKSALRML
jgi:Holliday junction DNA helicase RuvA